MAPSFPYWRLSGFYFFYFASLGSLLPFWSLYLDFSGFDAVAIGQLTALLVGTKVIAPNLCGWLADHTGKSMRIIRWASFLAAVIFSGFLFDPLYFGFAILTLGFSFFWNAALPQFEAVTLFHLSSDSHRYSQIRLWGSVGFIVTVLAMGYCLELVTLAVLPVIVLGLLVAIWMIAAMTPEVSLSTDDKTTVRLWPILKQPEVLAFLLVCLLLQAGHGPYYVFYSIYLAEHQYSTTLTGMLWALGVFSEIILFIFMRQILQKVSLRHILLTSIALAAIRWLMIGWGVTQLSVLIAAQVLHAATFGATHVVAIHLVHRYFGDQHLGKGQALYSSLGFGLGGMIGSLYSGFYWEQYGAMFVYSIAAVLSLVAFVVAYFWVGRNTKNRSDLSP